MEAIRLAILTVSDGVVAGTRADGSGDAIEAWARSRGHVMVSRQTTADESEQIAAQLAASADSGDSDLIITTGGTGFTARDVTPEATRAVVDRNVPGIPEAIRLRGAASTPLTWLSRGIAGIRGRTLIVNLPGSESGVRDGLAVLDDVVSHAIQLIRGIDTGTHKATHG